MVCLGRLFRQTLGVTYLRDTQIPELLVYDIRLHLFIVNKWSLIS